MGFGRRLPLIFNPPLLTYFTPKLSCFVTDLFPIKLSVLPENPTRIWRHNVSSSSLYRTQSPIHFNPPLLKYLTPKLSYFAAYVITINLSVFPEHPTRICRHNVSCPMLGCRHGVRWRAPRTGSFLSPAAVLQVFNEFTLTFFVPNLSNFVADPSIINLSIFAPMSFTFWRHRVRMRAPNRAIFASLPPFCSFE